MEFKGTRGKWEYRYDGNDYRYDIVSDYGLICSTMSAGIKDRYNALLISKAPEMLEMLKKLKDAMLELMEHQDGWEEDYEELEKLIKEATEL